MVGGRGRGRGCSGQLRSHSVMDKVKLKITFLEHKKSVFFQKLTKLKCRKFTFLKS